MNHIICIGNRLVPADAAGLAVYDRLQRIPLPSTIQLTEGGLIGLDLLPLLEQGGRVVFVDAVSGFAEAGSLVVLDQQMLRAEMASATYGHDAGLPYLLAILPHVCEGKLPEEITLIGLEGNCSDDVLVQAAKLSIAFAQWGCRPPCKGQIDEQ